MSTGDNGLAAAEGQDDVASSSVELPPEPAQTGLVMPWLPYWDTHITATPDLEPWMNLPINLHAPGMDSFGYREMYPSFGPEMVSYPELALPEGYEHDQVANEINSGTVGSASPTGSREATRESCLLETFYRLSVPTAVPRFTDEYLITYYFDNICPLISCFDSHLNPFRTLVSEMWSTSRTIYFAIQSMAIAHLTNNYPFMERLGLGKRSQAWKSLQLDLRRHRAGHLPLEELLMSLFLIGPSSAWYQRVNLGLQYLFIARNLMQAHLQSGRSQRTRHTPLKHQKFFHDTLMHWEMSASFVEPIAMMPFPGYGMPIPQLQELDSPRLPHPWTGVSAELTFALAEVGRILRRRRSRSAIVSERQLTSLEDPTDDADELWAQSLEDFLWSYRVPGVEDITDYEDTNTPTSDLVSAAKALKDAGLLELYAAFPRLLEKRALDAESPLNTRTIAFRILEISDSISISSGASRLLPLALLSAAGQLKLPDGVTGVDEVQDASQDDIIEARFRVESRILSFSRKWPQRSLLRELDIITETWSRLDDGHKDSHWLSVAHDKGWQTLVSP